MASEKSNVVALETKKLTSGQAVKKLIEEGYDQEKHTARVRKSYEHLIARGFRPVLLNPGVKAPTGNEWQKQDTPSIEDITGYSNIGIFTGEKGGSIVDIDCDDEGMLTCIEEFLPPTPYKFGRYYGGDKQVITHWLYRVSDPGKIYTGARRPTPDSHGKYPSIEVRCNGTQTMAPGSTIVDEKRGYIIDSVRWAGDSLIPPEEPIPETTRAYLTRCVNVAIITRYCAPYFKPGQFHNEMMWWCGFLISSGVDIELVEKSVNHIIRVTGQEDTEDRYKSIKTTKDNVDRGEKVAGISYLKQSPNWSLDILKWASKILNADQKELTDERPSVRIISSREPEWLDLTLDAMHQTGKFYQMSGQACIVTKNENKATIIPLDKTVNTCSWLTREIRFTQGVMDKASGVMTDEDIKCPTSLAQEIADPTTYKGSLRHIKGVSTTPLITPKGRIVENAWEFDEELKLFFSCEFPLQSMYVDEALPILMDALQDFPFLNNRYRAAAVGAILTAVIRPILDICPLHVITSSQYSDGKSVLSSLIAATVGIEASMGQLTRGGSDEEQEKQLSAILSRGRRVVTLDNHDGEFRSPALTETLTSENPEFRILGKNETRSVPNNTMFIVNGVNTLPALDLQTRSVFIRLARVTLDTQRQFKYPDVVGYVFDNRAKMVGAAIALIKHALAHGDGNWQPTHRFKLWDIMVRRTVMTVLGEDIAPPVIEDSERSIDPIEEVKQEFVEWVYALWKGGMRDKSFNKWFRAKNLGELVAAGSPQEGWINTISRRPNAAIDMRIGFCLNTIKDVPFKVGDDVIRLQGAVQKSVSVYKIVL